MKRTKSLKLFSAALALFGAAAGITAQAGTAVFDFTNDPSGILTTFGSSKWVAEGGNPGGYLSVTDAENGQSGSIVFDDFDNGSVVKAFSFKIDVRIGNGTASPADGFSINYARAGDDVLDDGQGWAASPTGEGNLPEEGTKTGLAIGFDAWFSGGADVIGISVRVDNVILAEYPFPTLNGQIGDPTSLQTGPRDESLPGDPSVLAWEPFEVDLGTDGKLNVKWKGNPVTPAGGLQTTFFPSPGRIVFAARTGGANQNHHVDNIRITTIPAAEPVVSGVSGTANTLKVTIDDSGTAVYKAGSASIKVDGAPVTIASSSKTGTTTTFLVNLDTFLAAGSHSVELAFQDTANNSFTSTRTYTIAPYVTLPVALKVATASGDGFNARVNQIDVTRGPGDANSISNAETQAADGFIDPSTGEPWANVALPEAPVVQRAIINWDQFGAAAGNFNANNGFFEDFIPGVPGFGSAGDGADNIVAEITTFLELKKGSHTLVVNSDDGFLVTAGFSPLGTRLGWFDGGRGAADTAFNIVAPEDGFYPIRLLWWEGGDGANIEFFSVDNATGERVLVNDRTKPNAIKAYTTGRTGGFLQSVLPVPNRQGVSSDLNLKAKIKDDLTTLVAGSVKVRVNGTQVAATVSAKVNGVTTITYKATPALDPYSLVPIEIEYMLSGETTPRIASYSVRTDLGSQGFSIEAEHFNYDNGKAIASVSTMPYEGGEYDQLSAVNGVDYAQGGDTPDSDLYRVGESPNVPMDSQLGADLDTQRPGFVVTTNYKIGWAGGDWYNYTRTVPAGKYMIFGAMSHGDGAGTADRHVARYGVVTSSATVGNQSVAMVGSYSTPSSGGWGNNLISQAMIGGQPTVIALPGGPITFRVFVDSGDWDWFTLIPTTKPTANPAISSVSPANGVVTHKADSLTIQIADFLLEKSIDMASIKVVANGTDITAAVTKTDNTEGVLVSYAPAGGLPAGKHTYSLTFKNSAGEETVYNGSVTIIGTPNNYIIEAEDFNFDGGQTIAAASTMPLQAGLFQDKAAVHNVDYFSPDAVGDANNYRIGEDPNVPMDPNNSRLNRGSFDVSQSFKIGWIGGGEWYNYTRDIPAGRYGVYAALSYDGRAEGQLNGSLEMVNGAATTSLGTFNAPGSGGWGVNNLVEMKNAEGQPAVLNLGGPVTLRYVANSGDYDYLTFVYMGAVVQDIRINIAAGAGNSVVLSWEGSATLQASESVSGPWSDVAGATSPRTVTADQAQRYYRLKQ